MLFNERTKKKKKQVRKKPYSIVVFNEIFFAFMTTTLLDSRDSAHARLVFGLFSAACIRLMLSSYSADFARLVFG